jgi:DNA-binding XRE family transcriptional regulator
VNILCVSIADFTLPGECIGQGLVRTVGDVADIGDVVAANVRAERGRRRWTQDQLADHLGWSRPTVSAVEAGRRKLLIAELPQLCRVFDVSLARLLLGADPDDVASLRLGEPA